MSIRSIGGEVFLHFNTIGHNLFREFETFRGGNNNNLLLGNNNDNNPLSPLRFKEKLEGWFNLSLRENLRGLDSNITALVNTLTGINLEVNHIKRESNHIKLIEFREMEAEDFNKWLERYNRIIEANKWSEYRRFQIIKRYLIRVIIR